MATYRGKTTILQVITWSYLAPGDHALMVRVQGDEGRGKNSSQLIVSASPWSEVPLGLGNTWILSILFLRFR